MSPKSTLSSHLKLRRTAFFLLQIKDVSTLRDIHFDARTLIEAEIHYSTFCLIYLRRLNRFWFVRFASEWSRVRRSDYRLHPGIRALGTLIFAAPLLISPLSSAQHVKNIKEPRG